MKVFDCHVHVANRNEQYSLAAHKKNIIYNSIEDYKARPSFDEEDHDHALSLILDYQNLDFVLNEINQGKIDALKIHSRIQHINESDYLDVINAIDNIPEHIPIIIDAFYSGFPLDYQPNLYKIIQVVTTFPRKTFVIAHCGGYKVLQYFFHLRGISNIMYDLSFSLQYLYDSSVFVDIKKLIKYTDKKKIMFGSDYPYADPQGQYDILESIFIELGVSNDEREDILYNNALKLFNK